LKCELNSICRPKYLSEEVDRHGKGRVYFRRKYQKKVALKQPIGSQEFLDEYRGAFSGVARTSKSAKDSDLCSEAVSENDTTPIGTFNCHTMPKEKVILLRSGA
jgi:hypothetical protein